MRAILFSDVHLVKEDVKKTELVQGFLKDCCAEADMVFILGDLFEFYHGYDGYIYPWYRGVVEALKGLAKNGKRVFFLEGNHEFGMGSFFEGYTGVTCSQDMTISFDDKKVFLSHGDALNFFCLGRVLKSRLIYIVMDILGPALTWRAANVAGFFLSRKVKPYSEKIKDIFRKNARKKLDEGYDAVVYGHSHIADTVEFNEEGKKKTYLNTGDFGKSCNYVLYDSAVGFTQERYNYRLEK